MIFCARATRGLSRPSPGLMARPGRSIAKQSEGGAGEKYLPVGGRVRKLRAVEDQSAPIPEERTSELEGSSVAAFDGHSGQIRFHFSWLFSPVPLVSRYRLTSPVFLDV